MADVVVIGGGTAGLVAAMLLAGDGHGVTVLERDPAPPPAEPADAWAAWERRGVGQFHLLHLFLPPFREVLEAELPAAAGVLDDAGLLRYQILNGVPEQITGGTRPGDERFEMLTGRRPVVEAALAAAAAGTPGVDIRRGVAVARLLPGSPGSPGSGPPGSGSPAGVPHVAGVVTEAGEELRADVVVDASGRRSAALRWLDDLGAPAPVEEREDCGFVYYGRHFRSADGSLPPPLGALLQHYESFSVLTLPADHGTWGVGICASANDPALRRLRHLDRWEAVVRACPLVAHWIDAEPLDEGVAVMARIEDRHRSFVVDDRPVITGILALGDAWACTNPSVGRGASIAALHAVALRDHLRTADPADAEATARGWHALTAERVEPWYRSTLAFDRHRLAEIDAQIAGRPYETDDPTWRFSQQLTGAAFADPDLFRAFLRSVAMLELVDDVAAAPDLAERVAGLTGGSAPAPAPGPSRAELEAIAGA